MTSKPRPSTLSVAQQVALALRVDPARAGTSRLAAALDLLSDSRRHPRVLKPVPRPPIGPAPVVLTHRRAKV